MQSKHTLNTNEHWINAIDFIGTFEISIFESWQSTHLNTTPNYIHKHVNHDLAIFCRVFSLPIAYLWKHKSCTQEDNLVTSALCTMCKQTEVKFLIRGQETPEMENGKKKKAFMELLSFSLPNLLLFPSSDGKAWALAEAAYMLHYKIESLRHRDTHL